MARTGKAFVRIHEEETNLICALAIDASGSMRFGAAAPIGPTDAAGSKIEYVQYLATALSHVISRTQDQVGLAVLERLAARVACPRGDGLARRTPSAGDRGARNAAEPSHGAGLRDLFERCRRRGVLMLMSDFLMEDLEEVFAGLRLFRHRGWDIVVLHVVHPDEERLPQGVAFRFEGMEDEGRVNCSPAEIAAAYRERFSGPSGDGSAVGPGRRLRLSPRLDGDPVFADFGRILGRESGIVAFRSARVTLLSRSERRLSAASRLRNTATTGRGFTI